MDRRSAVLTATDKPTSPTLDETLDRLAFSPRRRRGPRIDRAERLLEQPVRLGMLKALAEAESLTFTHLKKVLNTSDGNISVHARKLEGAGYIVCEKTFAGRIPRTEYRLTVEGRRALEQQPAQGLEPKV
jgi:DNA-binding MarR family transcriptional regulator